jgi:hypothetical protein
MRKIKIHPAIAFIAGILATLIIVLAVLITAHIDSFDNRIGAAMSPTITYLKDGKTEARSNSSISTDTWFRLTITEGMYFGKVSEKEYINITIPGNAHIRIYPYSDDSVIVEYDPQGKGFTERYIAFGSFEKHMQFIYETTGNEDFNVYPK